MTYLAVMPGKRKPKAITSGSLAFYKANAKYVYYYNGTAGDARRAIEAGRLKPFITNGVEHV